MVIFKRNLGPKGDSVGTSIPNEVLEWLNAKSGDIVNIQPIEPDGEGGRKMLLLWINEKEAQQ